MVEGIFPKGTGGFVQPEKVIDQLSIGPKMVVANFGCGHGYFTILTAKLVGPEGKIFAIDILKEALEAVGMRAKMENLANIEYVRANLEKLGSSKIGDGAVDMVIMANVLFQSQQKANILGEAKRILKSGGLAVVIDWDPSKSAMGPAESGWRLSREEMQKMVEADSFKLEKDIDAGFFHYGMIFIRQ